MGDSATRKLPRKIKAEHIVAAVAIAVTIGLAVAIVRYFDLVRNMGAYGYVGALVISILAGGTVFVPIPALAVVFALGGVLNPAWVGAAAGLGEAIGAVTIYLTGMGGHSLFQNRFPKVYPRVSEWVKRRGPAAVFLYSCIFNPLYYPLTLACGALRFGLWKFFFLTWAGKTVKGMIVAYAGYLGLRWVLGSGS
ncbi:MAG: VTT domain-containing protein [Chloroflexota bacterium]